MTGNASFLGTVRADAGVGRTVAGGLSFEAVDLADEYVVMLYRAMYKPKLLSTTVHELYRRLSRKAPFIYTSLYISPFNLYGGRVFPLFAVNIHLNQYAI